MVKKLGLVALVVAFAGVLAAPAHATDVITITDPGPFALANLGTAATAGEVSSSTIAVGSETISFSGGASSPTTGGTSGVYEGNVGGEVASPFGGNVGTPNYLAAQPGGSVTITFSALTNTFDLLWGSLDTDTNNIANNLVLNVGGGDTVTGAEVAAALGITNTGTTTVYVQITDSAAFGSVTATDPATNSAFEFVPAAVSETSTLGMLGIGLIGLIALGGFRRRSTVSC